MDNAQPQQAVPILRSDAEAIEATHRLAAAFLPGVAERDRDRRLPFSEMEQYSASGLGGITVPKAYGGPNLSAADASLGQLPQNYPGFVRLLRYEPDTAKTTLSEHGLDRHWRSARVHTLQDPVRWKFHAIGNHALKGVNPPVYSWI